ncbi:hypothetical protein [Tropicibacter oceani]|uniref:Uncharacterized protein n=1 Tax=Tropicibacter oceani TaxID=3058420 RepID=A0ABY8QIT8_9RHOB|nr:hypothetical protein [Tropicibacter oceani]WGW03906.1 hypothetical protein QF118_18625 [Tropicibacter oceani]
MFIVVGLIIAFVLVAVFSNRATRQCRWREYKSGADSHWHCVHCGAETTGAQGTPPKRCLRPDDA